MTTDDLVRDALRELAPSAPADDAALAGVRRAVTRHRRRRAAARVAVAAVVVVLLATAGLVARSGGGDEEGGMANRPDATTAPGGGTSTSSTTTPGTTAPGEPVTFARLRFELPAGWEVLGTTGDGGDGVERLCVGPSGNPLPRYAGCAGLVLEHGDPLPGFEMEDYRDHGPWQWYHATDVAPCPDDPDATGPDFDGIQATDEHGYDPVESGERPVGDGVAVYDKWEAWCRGSGFRFSPRAWHLTAADVVIYDILGRPETEAILETFEGADGSP